MKAIMVMFDSLNRHFLPNYGCDWTHAPNFQRLGERTVTFDKSYVCSMPCMPARRDLHTGRPNFLHRSWGPLEPFDDSVPEMLKQNGVYTHLATDHYHYFEEGGCTYHTRYTSWEFFRGQEGDPWVGKVGLPPIPDNAYGTNADRGQWRVQDWANREATPREEQYPQAQTMKAGLDFIERNRGEDNWFLQIETFDPHEPFRAHRKYQDLFAKHYDEWRTKGGAFWDWPNYAPVEESDDMVEHMRYQYASLMAMCDAYMGDVIDMMDKHNLWEDTMLIVCTDHGFMLGEHDMWAKCWQPFYEEISHTPFWVWDPRSGKKGERRQALVQPAIDLGPTLLEFFGIERTPDMLGKVLKGAVASDTPVREAAIFGIHGGHVNVTDGTYVLMKGPADETSNQPLADYTLMPTHMRRTFGVNELKDNIELAEPFKHTKGVKTMKVSHGGARGRDLSTKLFNVEDDPNQLSPIEDEAVEKRLTEAMVQLMKECDAPAEQYERLGVAE